MKNLHFAVLLATTALVMPIPAHAQATWQTPSELRNLLVCGDANTCPNQRGTSSIGGDIANTGTMTADFWEAIGGSSSAIDISVAAMPTTYVGYPNGFKFQRKSANANTAALHFGQVLDTDRAILAQGSHYCFSFTVEAGSLVSGTGFSALGALLTANVYAGTGTTEGYSSMTAGTWTGSAVVNTLPVTVSLLPNQWYVCGQVPAAATEVGVDFTWTPVGTAGASDYVTIAAVQFEILAPGQPLAPTPFEHHDLTLETFQSLRRAYVINEPAAAHAVADSGIAASATNCRMSIPFPVPMRAAPTLTASAITSGTTWQANGNGVAVNLTAIAVDGGNSTSQANFKLTTTTMTAGQGCGLEGKGGGATLTWSADMT